MICDNCKELDAVVHLAGIADERSLPEALSSHVITTAALLDAMVAHDVPPAANATPVVSAPLVKNR